MVWASPAGPGSRTPAGGAKAAGPDQYRGDRLERGEYGVCEDCGERVPYKRLLAFPTARRCLDCQERHERSAGAGRGATL